MKKQLYILAIGFIALASSSCNDFLDREPLDSVPTSQYLFVKGQTRVAQNGGRLGLRQYPYSQLFHKHSPSPSGKRRD